jgi:hypothetical protein
VTQQHELVHSVLLNRGLQGITVRLICGLERQ